MGFRVEITTPSNQNLLKSKDIIVILLMICDSIDCVRDWIRSAINMNCSDNDKHCCWCLSLCAVLE